MKTNKLRIIFTIFALCICCFLGSPLLVYGADGVLSIAVSSTKVEVGETLTVTLQAQGAGGEAATADMVFTYDTSVFSFVSCEGYYTGGEGGTVNASGGSVNLTLKAVSSGSGSLKVSGSNGKLKDSQEALSAMAAAGVRIEASGEAGGEDNANKSGDNSLSSLTLSQGELSPAFSYNVTEYTATVPYEVTDLEVDAKTSHEKAKIEDIIGNHQMEVGENRVAITVKAENGARVVYNIKVTRQAQGESSGENDAAGGSDAANTDPSGEQVSDDGLSGTDAAGGQGQTEGSSSQETVSPAEYEERIATLQESILQLEQKYKAEKAFSRKAIIILAAVTVLLLIVCVNLLFFRRRKKNDDFDWSDDEFEEEPAKQEEQTRPRFGFRKSQKQKQEDDLWPDEDEIMEDPFVSKTDKDKNRLSPKGQAQEQASHAGSGQTVQQTTGARNVPVSQLPSGSGMSRGAQPTPGLGGKPPVTRAAGLGSQAPQRAPGAGTGRIDQPTPGSGLGQGPSLRQEPKAREEIEFVDLDDL